MWKFVLLFFAFISHLHADTVIWSGAVQANGSASPNIKLVPGQMYQFNVIGTVAMGKWSRNGQPLVNDAAYEFNAVGTPVSYPIFKNSFDISLGDGKYHPDHVYKSVVFNAPREEIHFWVFATDYSDAKGAFAVEVVQVDQKSMQPVPIWRGSIRADGPPTPKIKLTAGKTYIIEASGTMSLGTWTKNGKPLMNDACYEFNAMGMPMLFPTFKNTLNISVCDGKYHPNHVYQSSPFVPEGEDISFWIFDTDYRDNSGELQVVIYQVGAN